MNPLLNAGEVSKYLGISKRSLESLLSKGEGPKFLWVGKQRRWTAVELINWTNQQSTQTNKGGQYLKH
jgi:predicted DNA-binding transcriptional regulator AlpA